MKKIKPRKAEFIVQIGAKCIITLEGKIPTNTYSNQETFKIIPTIITGIGDKENAKRHSIKTSLISPGWIPKKFLGEWKTKLVKDLEFQSKRFETRLNENVLKNWTQFHWKIFS